jgi:putative flippase GtrA
MSGGGLETHEMIVRYGLFAMIATGANIGAQELAMRLSPVSPLAVSILTGTLVGFAVKYVLDKLYVFSDAYGTHAEEARKVILYGAFSVATTIIFWSVEVLFWHVWQTTAAKYAGAVLGLAIGYAAKFMLDRRYVFGGRPA